MDPLSVNPLTILLNDIPVRVYFGLTQGLGFFLAYFLLKRTKLGK